MTMRGDNFNSPIWPIEVMLCDGSVVERNHRAKKRASKFCIATSAPPTPRKPAKPTTSTTASPPAHVPRPNRCVRNIHNTHKIKVASPQKYVEFCRLEWMPAEKRQIMKYGYETSKYRPARDSSPRRRRRRRTRETAV